MDASQVWFCKPVDLAFVAEAEWPGCVEEAGLGLPVVSLQLESDDLVVSVDSAMGHIICSTHHTYVYSSSYGCVSVIVILP